MSNNAAEQQHSTGPIIDWRTAPSETRQMFGLPPNDVTPIPPEQRRPPLPRRLPPPPAPPSSTYAPASATHEPELTVEPEPQMYQSPTAPLQVPHDEPAEAEPVARQYAGEPDDSFYPEANEPDHLEARDETTSELPAHADEQEEPEPRKHRFPRPQLPNLSDLHLADRLRDLAARHRRGSTEEDDEPRGHEFDDVSWEGDVSDEDSVSEHKKPVAGTIVGALGLALMSYLFPLMIVRTSWHWVADGVLSVLIAVCAVSAGVAIYRRHEGIETEHVYLARLGDLMMQYQRTATLILGTVFGLLMSVWYYYGMGPNYADSQYNLKSAVFGSAMGVGLALIVFVCLKQQEGRYVRPDQREAERENVFKKSAERDFWVLPEGDAVRYWAPLPWIDGVFLCFNGFLLAALAIWAQLHFPGGAALLETLGRGFEVSQVAWMLTICFVSPCLFVSLYSLQVKPLRNPPEEKGEEPEDNHREFTIGKRTIMVRRTIVRLVLGLAPLPAVWWWLDWPVVGWALRRFQEDPYQLAWLVFIPATIWSLARAAYFWGAFIGVTDTLALRGSTGILLGKKVRARMFRRRITNVSADQTIPGRIFGYDVVKIEGEGQMDKEFRRLRVVHGKEFEQVLGQPSPE